MSAYEYFKDFAGPLATATAALSAAFVTGLFAYRQSKAAELQADIALDKLKYETFELRHDVLDACRDLFRHTLTSLRTETVVDAATLSNLAERINAAKFYFGTQVCRTVDVYVRSVRALRNMQGDAYKQGGDVEERELAQTLLEETRREFMRAAALVDELLEYDLSLNLLKRGSNRRHGLPEQLRRRQARRELVQAVWARIRRPFT